MALTVYQEYLQKTDEFVRVPATPERNMALINARPRKVLNFHFDQEIWDFALISCCT